jgi:hypothetical protein
MLLYGWSIEKEVGGIPLPVIVMYIQGVAQLFCFPSLNTYCLVCALALQVANYPKLHFY